MDPASPGAMLAGVGAVHGRPAARAGAERTGEAMATKHKPKSPATVARELGRLSALCRRADLSERAQWMAYGARQALAWATGPYAAPAKDVEGANDADQRRAPLGECR
jgi:hypothetical protein